MPTAIAHAPPFTVPGSSTSTALVRWNGTGGNQIQDSTILVGATTMGLAADTDLVTFSSGTLTIAGTVAATTLTGAGAGITALAAANITASGTLPALNGAALTALTAANITASGTLPALVGTALTALNATNLGSGTVPVARLSAASTTAAGIAELAIGTEVTAGSSATLAVTPDALAASVVFGTRYVQCVVYDYGTDITEGNGKFFFHVPAGLNGMELKETHARVATAGSGSAIQVQLFLNTSTTNASTGNDMLTNLLTIDDGELDSSNSSVTEDIDETYDDVDTNDMIRIDVDGNGGDSTIAKGLIVTLGFRLP